MSVEQIAEGFENMVDEGTWDSGFACGTQSDGFFNRDAWWTDTSLQPQETLLQTNLAALGARQVMFGHDPQAFGSTYQMEGYFGDAAGRALIKLDMAISGSESRGSLYRCSAWLADGGCAKPLTAVNPEAGSRASFAPLPIHQGLPPALAVAPEVGDWCAGKGQQKPY